MCYACATAQAQGDTQFAPYLPAGRKAQNNPTQEFSLQHDNDFLLGIDRYYTTGTFLSYSRMLSDTVAKNSKVLRLSLGQETYTPRDLFSRNFDDLERPYAGYLFINAGLNSARNDDIWILEGEFGLAGPQSLAGEFQVAYHRLINEFIPVWQGEIANSVHINAYGTYVKSFQKSKKAFLDIESTIAFGTRQLYAEQAATFFIGKRSEISQTSFYNRLSGDSEFYSYAKVYGRWIGLNALIQGHPLGDQSPFTLPIENLVAGIDLGVTWRKNNYTIQLSYSAQTRESIRESNLRYTSLIIKKAW